ncbi:MAG: DUF2911 domain-containing protein [Fulvivirga sp.]
MNIKPTLIRISLSFILFLVSVLSYGQNVDVPQMSQRAKVSQRLWMSDVTISYNSPPADGETFGRIIPYGEIWGAGDRENTTIEFLDDVLLEGREVKAGKYGLFMIPRQDEFTLILSRYAQSWFDTYPTDDEIVLQVNVKPETIPYRKWLNYDFIERRGLKIIAAMQWGTTQVPFQIDIVNPNEVLVESLKAQLKGREKFLWGAYSDAASNLHRRNIYPELALDWIDKSLEIERNHVNLQLKASILLKKGGLEAEIKELLYEAIPIMSNPLVFNSAIYDLLQVGDTKKAIEAAHQLTQQFSDHPRIWMFTDTLAEAYLKDGNKKKAIEYYKLAQAKAPEAQQSYFRDVLAGLEK